jgi:hypothetical protein
MNIGVFHVKKVNDSFIDVNQNVFEIGSHQILFWLPNMSMSSPTFHKFKAMVIVHVVCYHIDAYNYSTHTHTHKPNTTTILFLNA